jgi:hypothetical protein
MTDEQRETKLAEIEGIDIETDKLNERFALLGNEVDSDHFS